MLIYANEQFFPCSPASLDIPRGVLQVGRTNMVSKHELYGEKTLPIIPYNLSSGWMDPYTNCGI